MTAEVDLETLYATELPFVYGFLHRLGARGGDLEDLSHDVFVTAMKRWNSFDKTRPVRPWLLGIAFRVSADWRRRAGHTREVVSDVMPERAAATPGGEERIEQRERRELIEEALASLNEERRAVFVMYELEGMQAPEISEAMGAPVATTYSRLRVGREEFADAVKRIQLRRGEAR